MADAKAEGAASFEESKALLIRLFGNAHNGTLDNLLRAAAAIASSSQKNSRAEIKVNESSVPELEGAIFNVIETCRDARKWTCLHFASAGGNLPIVKAIVEKDPRLNVAIDEDGLTPLMIASRHAEIDVCRLLLASASELLRFEMLDKACLSDGRTTLHYAVQSGHIMLVKLLLEAKTNVRNYR